ncbi:asparagine synthase-related protein [Brooklawnia sp.]|uniref:asparagine synthase-related protein n=1 Tax=Brooklawnia sp. TaxID=2699740 RepID=UPI00311F0C8F
MVRSRASRLLLFGTADLGKPRSEAETAQLVDHIDTLYEHVAGSYLTILARDDARVRAHGTLSGTHQIFCSRVDDVTVAASRAALLAELAGSSVRTELISTLLLAPRAPWPLSDEPLWEGVRLVPSTHSITIQPDGSASTVPRWSYPAHREPLTELAPQLHSALHASVATRAALAPVLSSDLSGGLDSTTLAFLADEHTDDLLTVRQNARDVTNDDAHWAVLASSRMRSRRHIQINPHEAKPWYTDWSANADNDLGSPYPALRTLGLNRCLAQRVAQHGSTLHLTGLGGDELFSTSFTHLHALIRQNPLRALRPVRGMQAIARWKTVATYRALIHSEPHATWLRNMANNLTSGLTMNPQVDWEPESRMPPWATKTAVESARDLIHDSAKAILAEADSIPVIDFEMLRLVNADGTLIRRMSQSAQQYGVDFEAPFLDDRIVDLAFRVQLTDRVAHGVFKPVLQAAMPNTIPPELRTRRSKGDYSAEAYAGLAENRPSMIREFETGSLLHDQGLIDASAFCDFLTAIHPSTEPLRFLDNTLGTEIWLRFALQHQGERHATLSRQQF